jgi:sialate O-acetylesterase
MHKFSRYVSAVLVLALVMGLTGHQVSASADDALRLPTLFADHMVLQRSEKVPVWGWASPGTKVIVAVAEQKKQTKANKAGRWETKVGPFPAGGPHTMTITAGDESIALEDILIGEVWVCSGQSNMEMPLKSGWASVINADEEIAKANYPNIRLFDVINTTSLTPLTDAPTAAGWTACTPETTAPFSAVGYFFGRHLHEELGIPIGLIHSSWGGTPAEAWTSTDTLKTLPDYAYVPEWLAAAVKDQPELEREYKQALDAWLAKFAANDKGSQNGSMVWSKPTLDIADWKTMDLPVLWEEAGLPGMDGTVWFRKDIDLPADWAGKDLQLRAGQIDDMDITWFNGEQVGATMEDGKYNVQRNYTVPGALVKAGRNTVVVRVVDTGGGGGIYGDAAGLAVTSKESGAALSIAGPWRYAVGGDLSNLPPKPQTPPGANNPHTPSVLYNAMINPLIPYRIKGAIWYQGESNAGRAHQYRTLFSSMIQDWRKQWDQGDFPFFFVQLANFQAVKAQPAEDSWAELREAQNLALKLPNTGVAVAIDIGEADDIHPRNKQDVGKRLALAARHVAYGQELVYSGPRYQSMQTEGNTIRVRFNHTGSGLLSSDGAELQGFAIAAEPGKFHWAQARIDGDSVVVSSEDVANPVAVRYAWATNPECNLTNREGLPASPFRTDTWPGITEGNK